MEEPLIVYPGAIICFLQIISCVPRMADDQVETYRKTNERVRQAYAFLVLESFTILSHAHTEEYSQIRSEPADYGLVRVLAASSLPM